MDKKEYDKRLSNYSLDFTDFSEEIVICKLNNKRNIKLQQTNIEKTFFNVLYKYFENQIKKGNNTLSLGDMEITYELIKEKEND